MVLEKTLESPLDCKEIKPVNPKGNQSWIFIGRTEAKAETPFGHLMRRTDSLEKTLMLGLRARGKGVNSGWDGWMASLSRWKWVWPSSGSWWWTGKPGMLQPMGCKEWIWLCNRTELNYISIILISIWLFLIINFTQYVPYFVSQCFLRLFLETILTFLFELKNKVEFFSLTKQCDLANSFTTRIGFAKCFAVDISGYWVT